MEPIQDFRITVSYRCPVRGLREDGQETVTSNIDIFVGYVAELPTPIVQICECQECGETHYIPLSEGWVDNNVQR